MGVVTDLGSNETMTLCSTPISLQIQITLTIPTKLPTIIEEVMDRTFPFKYPICSYKT